ncbi:NAD(P)/FAD-dependent oxidoreductase [Algoriphagus namhaensis]|uniref:NAD(P)/FAD-dependent oxidoreductase n=1 Tax=Algoriphagus namhaensis TaxID=915353 RepID=A0ABV8ATB0_9BACT
MSNKLKIAVIGGGAAGFFSAIHAADIHTDVHLFEKSSKLLSKVKISGGGRCNVTHRPLPVSSHVKNYPRGEKFLKKVFPKFTSQDTMDWFESKGVPLKIESDGRVFPVSDDSQSIINALTKEAQKSRVQIHLNSGVSEIKKSELEGFELNVNNSHLHFDRLIICTGGHPKLSGFEFLSQLGHKILDPIPSLFTFNTPGELIRELKGISFPDGHVKLAGSKLNYRGPVLITHWGVSGPAVLKLSAFGAKWLFEREYKAEAIINWVAEFGENDFLAHLLNYINKHPQQQLAKHPLFGIPSRFWSHLCWRSGITEGEQNFHLSKKQVNKLVQNLFCYNLPLNGKTTFKEEFVTSGGVDLNEVDSANMESKIHLNLFFAGEVLDIDGITGGFNFQAAWSTGFLAGKSAKSS